MSPVLFILTFVAVAGPLPWAQPQPVFRAHAAQSGQSGRETSASAPTAGSADAMLQIVARTAAPGVNFGELFTLEIERSYKKGATPPAWRDDILNPLVVRALGVETSTRDDMAVELRKFEARAFVLDELSIPAVGLHLIIKSSLPDSRSAVEPPPDLFEKPFPWRSTLLWSAVALAAAVAFVLFMIFIRRRARRAPAIPNAPLLPTADAFLARIESLRRLQVDSEAGLQQFYVEGSAIVREYMEIRFQIAAPEMTTEEFLYLQKQSNTLTDPHRDLLADYLKRCDYVKFARGGSSTIEREQLLASAERFIQETRVDSHGATPMTSAPTAEHPEQATRAREVASR